MKVKDKPISSYSNTKLIDMLQSLATPNKTKDKIRKFLSNVRKVAI